MEEGGRPTERAPTVWIVKGEPAPAGSAIRFENVTFGYDPDEPVLHGFTLDIEAGSSVALVGSTGSGKSTVARLLVRFYDPQSGSISLDGVDLDWEFPEESHAQQFTDLLRVRKPCLKACINIWLWCLRILSKFIILSLNI